MTSRSRSLLWFSLFDLVTSKRRETSDPGCCKVLDLRMLSHFRCRFSSCKSTLLRGVTGVLVEAAEVAGSAFFGKTVTTVVEDEVAAVASDDDSLLRQNIPPTSASEVGGNSS